MKWAESQRPLNQKAVKRIADNLDPSGIGVICVARIKGSNEFHIIDGQHRVAAVKSLWGDTQQVPCEIIEDADSPEDAAKIWLKRNTSRTKPQAYDRFLVAVTAGEELETAVHKVIRACGYDVGYYKLMAVSSCITAYKQVGAYGLAWVLTTIREIWGDEPEAVGGHIIRGLAEFRHRYEGQKIDTDRLIKTVSARYTPSRLLGAARTIRDTYRGNMADAVCHVLTQTYNQRLRQDSQLKD